jgi:hypothetical protein
MLQVLKLFVEARDAPVKEVHFEGSLPVVRDHDQAGAQQGGRSSRIEDTLASSARARPRRPSLARVSPDENGVTPRPGPRPEEAAGGRPDRPPRQGAREEHPSPQGELPIYYPTLLETGTDYAQKPRVYKINGTGGGSPPNSERAAYKWVFSRPALGEYYGFMATRWKEPPILKNPSEERELDGRTYKLYYDGDRLKMIAWQDDEGSFWLHNTLIQSLSDREMIDIAKGMTELPKLGKRN